MVEPMIKNTYRAVIEVEVTVADFGAEGFLPAKCLHHDEDDLLDLTEDLFDTVRSEVTVVTLAAKD